jgi:hypothetical protein
LAFSSRRSISTLAGRAAISRSNAARASALGSMFNGAETPGSQIAYSSESMLMEPVCR